MDIAVNYLAVIAAAVAAFAVGAVWHSPIGFGKQWMRMMGLSEKDMHTMPLSPMQAMVGGFFATLLTAYVLAVLATLTGAATTQTTMQLALWVWLGFLAPTLANSWLWEGRPLALFAFNAAYALVAIQVMALVLGLLH